MDESLWETVTHPKDPNLQRSINGAARVAHNLVMYDKLIKKK
jgi:hypothetical protein